MNINYMQTSIIWKPQYFCYCLEYFNWVSTTGLTRYIPILRYTYENANVDEILYFTVNSCSVFKVLLWNKTRLKICEYTQEIPQSQIATILGKVRNK